MTVAGLLEVADRETAVKKGERDEASKKVTFEASIKSPTPRKARRKSVDQLMMTHMQSQGRRDTRPKITIEPPDEKQEKKQQNTVKRRSSLAVDRNMKRQSNTQVPDNRKSKHLFVGEMQQKASNIEIKKNEGLKKFESMREKAQAQKAISYLSKKQVSSLIREKQMMNRPLTPLGPSTPQSSQQPRIDRPAARLDDFSYNPFPTARRSSLNLYSNYEVIEVLTRIQENKNDRQKDDIKKELKKILKRVRMDLAEMDIDFDEEEAEDETGIQRRKKIMEAFDIRSEREKMQERNYFSNKLEEFEVKAVTRHQYLTELMLWFEENLHVFDDCLTPEEIAKLMREAIHMHEIIMRCLNAFTRTGDRIVEVGTAMLCETGKIIKEKKDMLSRKTKKERIIVYDDKMLLTDPIKWESAVKTIICVFEDSFKMIKNLNYKNALKLGQKQFDYLVVAAEKRYKELDEKKKQCNEIQGKLHSAKMANDKMVKELEEQKRKTMKTTTELNETKQALDKMKEKNKDLTFKMIDMNNKIKNLEEELEKKLKTPTPPPTPPPPPEPEKIIVKVVDSATELRLHEVEEELAQAKAQIEALAARVEDLEGYIKKEQDVNKELQTRITELESIEIPEPEPTPPVAPELPPPPEPSSDKDSSYYKTLMAGMKNEFAAELEKMKAHVRKEKNRNEANVRRLELQQKEQLSSIQKDTLRMLRAIMHFRDQMIMVLEKENLGDPAQALQDLGSLLKDKLSPDPREVLAQVVVSVVEYLHKTEGILANAFLAMKVMMKYQVEKQVEAEMEIRKAREKRQEENKKVVKDIGKRKNVLSEAKDDVHKLAKKLKKAKNKLKKYQADLEGSSDKRYQDLMMRYKQVWRLYRNMQKEMEMLQHDFNKTMQQKLEEKETMIVTQFKRDIKQRRALNEEQLKISIADQRQNLKLLSKAYEDNKISKELHTMAVALIEKTIEIPRIKLQHLFEQYIVYRTVQESKARVAHVLQDEELAIDVRKDMEMYMEQIDKKFGQNMTKWRTRLSELEVEKSSLNKKIYSLFNEVLVQTGLLLVHPLLKDADKTKAMVQAAATMDREKMKALLGKRRRGYSMMMKLPDAINGCQVPIEQTREQMWATKFPPVEPTPKITEPHMLAYDINRQRLMSIRTMKSHTREYPVFKSESFNIAEQNGLQFIREMPFYRGKRRPILCQR